MVFATLMLYAGSFFSSIEYVFATITTTDNCIACGGSVLREIAAALVSDNQVLSKYADLCDYNAASSFSSSNVATCFQFCLLVFGRVRAKDLASKYNATRRFRTAKYDIKVGSKSLAE